MITGSTKGIGASIAMACAGQGASGVVLGRSSVEDEAAMRIITEAGGTAMFVHCDVLSERIPLGNYSG